MCLDMAAMIGAPVPLSVDFSQRLRTFNSRDSWLPNVLFAETPPAVAALAWVQYGETRLLGERDRHLMGSGPTRGGPAAARALRFEPMRPPAPRRAV
jgi:hypothetical protein